MTVADTEQSRRDLGAFRGLTPIRSDYATVPIWQGFNWSECVVGLRKVRLYLVVFRSVRRETADAERLKEVRRPRASRGRARRRVTSLLQGRAEGAAGVPVFLPVGEPAASTRGYPSAPPYRGGGSRERDVRVLRAGALRCADRGTNRQVAHLRIPPLNPSFARSFAPPRAQRGM